MKGALWQRTVRWTQPFDLEIPADAVVVDAALLNELMVVTLERPAGCDVRVYGRRKGNLVATFELERAARAQVRVDSTYCTLCDDLGRLLLFDHTTGRLLRSLRIAI